MTKVDYRALIQADLDKGFTKTQLEKLIGLPKNNLTYIMSGNKEFSKLSTLKIDKWEASEKPNPLTLVVPKKKKGFLTDHLGGNTIGEIFDVSKIEEMINSFGTEGNISSKPYNLNTKATAISATNGKAVTVNITEENHVGEKPAAVIEYPQILSLAKSGATKEQIDALVSANKKLTPGQKSMITSKLK